MLQRVKKTKALGRLQVCAKAHSREQWRLQAVDAKIRGPSIRQHLLLTHFMTTAKGELKTSSHGVNTWIRGNDPSAGSPTER
jgi:hypothetical protein